MADVCEGGSLFLPECGEMVFCRQNLEELPLTMLLGQPLGITTSQRRDCRGRRRHWNSCFIDGVRSADLRNGRMAYEHRLSGLYAQAKEGGTRLVVEAILGESKLATMAQSSPQIGHISLSKVNDEKSDKDYSRFKRTIHKDGTWSRDCNASVTSEIRALVKRERLQDVLQGLEQWGISLDASMYKLLLQRCTLTKNLVEGQKVHAHMTTTGFMPDIQLSNVILNMYCKCGSLSNARQFFDAMKERDMISWTLMLGGYTKKGLSKEGFELYEQSQVAGVRCDRIMYVSIVSICASLGDVRKGKAVHTDIKKAGIATDVILESNLVHMYAKCGSMKLAHEVFDKMVERNVVSWNAMIAGSLQNGDTEEAFELFQQMQHENVKPDRITFTSLLSACASPEALKLGHWIHAKIIKAGLEADVHVGTSLVSMFAKCGSTQDAQKVFDKMVVRNVVSWNAMINGYAEHGQCDDAIEIFHLMQHKGFKPNSGTFIGLLKACAKQTSVQKTGGAPARSIPAALGSDFKQGQWVHANIIQAGLETDLRVGNALINMFVKCGSVQDAQRVFDKMEVRDVISWTAMIEGYAEHGPFGKAKEVFHQMQCNGIEPDLVTFICLIKACANQASLQEARWVHSIIEVAGFGSDLRVATSMVHMYAKCGSVIDARSIFNKMHEQDLATWNAMIVGLAQHGYGREALQHFHQMILEGLCPNGLTYLGVLSACGHAGFVDEGLGYFFSMSKDYAISPTVEHFGCMVDLLGRAGELDEAEDFVNKMPQTPGAAVWGSLLGACRLHGNVSLAEVVARFLLGFDPQNAAVYVSLAHIYATANLWDKATSLKKLMRRGEYWRQGSVDCGA